MKKILLFFFFLHAIGMERSEQKQVSVEVEIKKAGFLDWIWFGFFGPNMHDEFIINKHTGQKYRILTIYCHFNYYKRVDKSIKLNKIKSLELKNIHVRFLRPVQGQNTPTEEDIFRFKPGCFLRSEDGSVYIDLKKVHGYDPDQLEDIVCCHFNAQTINDTLPIKPVTKMTMLIDKVSVREIEE